jgi:hypothetical protein
MRRALEQAQKQSKNQKQKHQSHFHRVSSCVLAFPQGKNPDRSRFLLVYYEYRHFLGMVTTDKKTYLLSGHVSGGGRWRESSILGSCLKYSTFVTLIGSRDSLLAYYSNDDIETTCNL